MTAKTKPCKVNTKHQQTLCVRHFAELLLNIYSTKPWFLITVEGSSAFVSLVDDKKLFEVLISVVVVIICVDVLLKRARHLLFFLFLCLRDRCWQGFLFDSRPALDGCKDGWLTNVVQPGRASFVAPSGWLVFLPTISIISFSNCWPSLCLVGIVALWTFTSLTVNLGRPDSAISSLRSSATYVLFKYASERVHNPPANPNPDTLINLGSISPFKIQWTSNKALYSPSTSSFGPRRGLRRTVPCITSSAFCTLALALRSNQFSGGEQQKAAGIKLCKIPERITMCVSFILKKNKLVSDKHRRRLEIKGRKWDRIEVNNRFTRRETSSHTLKCSHRMTENSLGAAQTLCRNSSAGTRLSKHLEIICWSNQLDSINLQMNWAVLQRFLINCKNTNRTWAPSRNHEMTFVLTKTDNRATCLQEIASETFKMLFKVIAGGDTN